MKKKVSTYLHDHAAFIQFAISVADRDALQCRNLFSNSIVRYSHFCPSLLRRPCLKKKSNVHNYTVGNSSNKHCRFDSSYFQFAFVAICHKITYLHAVVFLVSVVFLSTMSESTSSVTASAPQEFRLEPDTELRFEVESKNEKVTLEVLFHSFYLFYLNYHSKHLVVYNATYF